MLNKIKDTVRRIVESIRGTSKVSEVAIEAVSMRQAVEAAEREAPGEAVEHISALLDTDVLTDVPGRITMIRGPSGANGEIEAPIGASLRSIYSACVDIHAGPDGDMRYPLPWVQHVDTLGSRKAAYYVEHRDGRSFSLRRRIPVKSKAITVAGKPAVHRKPAHYVRQRRSLAPGWTIERVA